MTFSNNAIGTFNGGIEFANNGISVGGAAIVNVLSGADLTAAGRLLFAVLDGNTSATLIVRGEGSTFTQTGANVLTAGHATAGTATIKVLDGGAFTTGTGIITIAQSGTLLLDGISSRGSFRANGAMTVRGSVQVGQQPGNAGGALTATAGLTVDGGTVHLAEGVITANSISLTNGGVVDIIGGTLHVATFNGNFAQLGGTLAPGSSPGTTTINGNYAINSGTLAIEISGLAQGSQFDFLDVNGSATLAGTLAVTLINNFTPAAGNSFDVLDWNSLSGAFATLQLPALNTGLMWNASRLYTVGILSVTIIGDYNANGIVDAADYVVWRKSLGQTGTGLAADGNGNNQIDSGDYDAWRIHFGQASGSGSGHTVSAVIPEPPMLAALIIAVAALCGRRGRRT